jgi:transposase InsO family protein/transposase-like protein
MNKYQKKGFIFTSIWDGFPQRPVVLKSKYDRWRQMAKDMGLSREACLRLEWIIYYYTKAGQNARLTCRHFGLTPKTFYKWFDRFEETNLGKLEDQSRAPKNTRKREYTSVQYLRIVELRKQYIRYGKMKLLKLYENLYPDDQQITSWKVQCMIERSGIYYHPKKQARINRKKRLSQKRKKITELKMKRVKGFLLCIDTVVIYWMGKKRYIVTAIDKWSKVAYARMYTTHSSYNTRDFLYRLYYLLDGKIENIQTDNGSEFKKYFDQGCEKLKLDHYHSRVKTPKDNPDNERFNRTLQEEFIVMGNMTDDVELFNQRLTEWLIHYNFQRPHQTLDYMPPINFSFKYHKVLPMYPSSTND